MLGKPPASKTVHVSPHRTATRKGSQCQFSPSRRATHFIFTSLAQSVSRRLPFLPWLLRAESRHFPKWKSITSNGRQCIPGSLSTFLSDSLVVGKGKYFHHVSRNHALRWSEGMALLVSIHFSGINYAHWFPISIFFSQLPKLMCLLLMGKGDGMLAAVINQGLHEFLFPSSSLLWCGVGVAFTCSFPWSNKISPSKARRFWHSWYPSLPPSDSLWHDMWCSRGAVGWLSIPPVQLLSLDVFALLQPHLLDFHSQERMELWGRRILCPILDVFVNYGYFPGIFCHVRSPPKPSERTDATVGNLSYLSKWMSLQMFEVSTPSPYSSWS